MSLAVRTLLHVVSYNNQALSDHKQMNVILGLSPAALGSWEYLSC